MNQDLGEQLQWLLRAPLAEQPKHARVLTPPRLQIARPEGRLPSTVWQQRCGPCQLKLDRPHAAETARVPARLGHNINIID